METAREVSAEWGQLSAERERENHWSTTGLSGLLLFHATVHFIPDTQPADMYE